jgi:hypothetical protein
MKKSTVKAAKTPATAKKAPAKIVKKPAAAPVKRAAAPAVKKPAAKSAPTVITALIDVGFGNALYVRGEGAGLSWDAGVLLDCAADDQWTISLAAADKPVVFKLLINDSNWSVGPDYVAEPGKKVTVTPTF